MPELAEERGPDFIGVGPGKTGTSWIHNHLRTHPNVIFRLSESFAIFGKTRIFPTENSLNG
jgi:hypothetical protein